MVATTQGGYRLSKARYARANRKFSPPTPDANTIDFRTSLRRERHIQLVPKTLAQERLILSLLDACTPVTIAVGPAGTGKSYLAVLAALQKLKTRECSRIILTRPAVGVENEQHGFLPGDLTSKMEPWMRPLIDVVQKHYSLKDIENMLREGIIEIAPLAFMRGRTFDQAWIVADEMQNATPNQIKMLLTRIGKDSKIVVTGDIDQTDRPGVNNGLADICQRLSARPTPGISVCELTSKDVQRHPIIDRVLELYVA